MNDTLFDLPDATPDRLALARKALSVAEEELERAELANEELPIGIQNELDAVIVARYELRLAELERLAKRPL